MKNRVIAFATRLLAVVVLLTATQACNSTSSGDVDIDAMLVTIVNPSESYYSYYFCDDDGVTYYPTEFSEGFETYAPTDGQRAIIYYSELETQRPGYNHNIKLHGLRELLTKDITIGVEGTDYGDHAIVPVQYSNNTGYDCSIRGGYFTLSFYVLVQGSEEHEINLVTPTESRATDDPQYLQLELRHKVSAHLVDATTVSSMASFRLGGYDPTESGLRGIQLYYIDFMGNTQQIKIEK
jgi:hypothetical protein